MKSSIPEGSRIAFFGNVANSQFRAAEALRSQGVDAHLFISRTDPESGRPESSEPALRRGYPPWIHLGDWVTPSAVINPRSAPITERLAEFDALIASGPGPIFAQFAGPPWAFMVTGGDLTVKPFPVAFRKWYPNWRHRMAQFLAGAWQRRAARRADQVWLQPFSPMVEAADRLGIEEQRRVDQYLPLVVDTKHYSPETAPSEQASEFVASLLAGADFVVFHPSRLVMDSNERLVRTGQWKGNERLIEGFAGFVKRQRASNARLVLIDSGMSRDASKARALIEEFGIKSNTIWARPPSGEYFDSDYMLALYQGADVVCDEFGVGWFGYVTLEGLAVGRPVLSHVDEAVMRKLYPNNPIIDATQPDEIASGLRDLYTDCRLRSTAGSEGRAWATTFHSEHAAAGAYLRTIKALFDAAEPVAPESHRLE